MDQDAVIENLRFHGKSFEDMLHLLLLKCGGDFSISNGVYYIIEAQKRDLQNKFLTTLIVPLQWISVQDLQRLLPQSLNASAKIKLDDKDSRVVLSGTTEELKPILDFIALVDTGATNDKTVRIDLSFLKSDEVIPLLPSEYSAFGPVALPTKTGFVIGMPEKKLQGLREFVTLVDRSEQSLPITLNYIKADELIAALPPSAAEKSIKKTPDPRLVFYTGPESARKAFLRDLSAIDRPKPQVKYQILVLSVAETNDDSWEPGLTLSASTASPGAVLQKGVFEGLMNLGFDVIASFGIDFALSLQWKILNNKANVVADTVLAALSGEKITFKNTTTVRVKDTEVVSSSTTTTTQIVREISSGLILNIEGWVSGNRMITMKLESTLSDNVSSDSDTDLPKTTEKVFTTTVRTQVGKPIAVTGLKQKQLVESVAKIPLLGDIPWVGKVFRTKSKSLSDTQYLIYIIPRLEMPEVNREALERSLVEDYYRYLFAQDAAGVAMMERVSLHEYSLPEGENQFALGFMESNELIKLSDGAVVEVGAVSDPSRDLVDRLVFSLGRPVAFKAIDKNEFSEFISRYAAEVGTGTAVVGEDDENTLDRLANDAPVINLVNSILMEGLRLRCSDIHLEGHPEGLRVRFRVDGALETARMLPIEMARSVSSRIKVMSNLNIIERRLPQDGKMNAVVGDRPVEFRVSIVPTIHGESIVLRLFDRDAERWDLGRLGFDEPFIHDLRTLMRFPHGLVLVTGPTGSGKTTTLSAVLNELNSPDRKIITVEDPVENRIPGVLPGPDERRDRHVLRHDSPQASQAGPGHPHDRRDTRSGDRRYCLAERAHGPSGLGDAPYERRSLLGRPPGQHGARALPSRGRATRRRRATSRAQALSGLLGPQKAGSRRIRLSRGEPLRTGRSTGRGRLRRMLGGIPREDRHRGALPFRRRGAGSRLERRDASRSVPPFPRARISLPHRCRLGDGREGRNDRLRDRADALRPMSQLYKCRVVDSEGRPKVIERSASSPRSLSLELRKEGLGLVACSQAEERRNERLSQALILEFTEGLELLFAQNLCLKDAVRVLKTIETRPRLKALVASLEDGLAKGQSMAQALEPYKDSFPPLYLGLIRIGELSGNLKSVLPQLKRYLRGKKKMREKVLGSLMYPALILIVLVAGMAALTAFVLPTFLKVAESLGGKEGGLLRSRLVGFQTAFIVVFAALLGVAGLFALARRRPRSRLVLDRFFLTRHPFDRLFAPMELQNLCFALGSLLESGYAVEVALGECAGITGNRALASALEEARGLAQKGQRLSSAFRATGLFPETFCSWIAVGEEAHDLRPAIARLREYYEGEFEKLSGATMNLIEPVLILLVGAILLLVILQFIGPIYALLGGIA